MKISISRLFKVSDSTGACLVWFVVIAATLVFNSYMSTSSINPDSDMIVMDHKTVIKSYTGRDTVVTQVKAGDSLRLLGYRRASFAMPHKLWVETAGGTRGFIDMKEFSIPMIVKKGNRKGDTVSVTGIEEKGYKYDVTFSDGTDEQIYYQKLMPVMSDRLSDRTLNPDTRAWFMSKGKFERLYLGRTFGECDSLRRPAIHVVRTAGGIVAEFEVRVFDPADGKFYRPVVTFNDSLVASSYELFYKSDRSDWLLKRLPLVAGIVDADWLSSLIQGPLYKDVESETPDSWWMWTLFGIFMVLYVGGFFVWVFCTGAAPTLLMGFLVRFRHVYYPLGDKSLRMLLGVVTIGSVYVWSVLMLLWGMFWPFLAAIFMASFYLFVLTASPLDHVPHVRCLGCRRLHTMRQVAERIVREHDEWVDESKEGELLGKKVRKWDTWTDRITTRTDGYGNKHVSTDRINMKHHTETTRTVRMHEYKVLLHITDYEQEHRCRFCNQKELTHSTSWREIDRKYLGSYVTTDVSEDVD